MPQKHIYQDVNGTIKDVHVTRCMCSLGVALNGRDTLLYFGFEWLILKEFTQFSLF